MLIIADSRHSSTNSRDPRVLGGHSTSWSAPFAVRIACVVRVSLVAFNAHQQLGPDMHVDQQGGCCSVVSRAAISCGRSGAQAIHQFNDDSLDILLSSGKLRMPQQQVRSRRIQVYWSCPRAKLCSDGVCGTPLLCAKYSTIATW